MLLTPKQLDVHLAQSLSSLYLISGDVLLLVQETRDAIITAAKSHGFFEKERFYIEPGFQIESLILSLKNAGLFDQKKIIDIRNASAKFDATLTELIEEYIKNPVSDRLLIISTDKLTPAQQKSSWFETIKKQGVFIAIWPITLDAMPQWIIERAKKLALMMPMDVARLLAAASEGNLLAVQQTLEKLQLLYPHTAITREQLLTVLSDHARFSIFDLSDAITNNNSKKIIRILSRLQQSGEEPVLVLWSICRTIRDQMRAGKNARYQAALQYAAEIDEMIKGAKSGDVWQALLQLCLGPLTISVGACV